ncbi:MAG TPA: MFS transporter [Candidatus Dormibacteraeota bacterium]|nr:MFS transporter [Candidatus Dormibacteraeota bacterium]
MKPTPFRFVFIIGVVSLFADMTYEGGRSIAGPFLAHLGATGLIVGLIAGLGELIGYGFRIVSGVVADRTRRYWPITFLGYGVNVLSVPALALAHAWPAAGALLVGERFGRGIRKPAVSAMLAHAGSQIGQGWVFGFHESMDQAGATVGPLLVAAVLAFQGGFAGAFGVLAIPGVLALLALTFARAQYPSPRDLEPHPAPRIEHFGRAYWIYAGAGACVAAGFADFALVSFHFSKAHVIANHFIPILYAVAMLVGAVGAPFFGRFYDRSPLTTVLGAFALAAFFAPLCFLGNEPMAIAGVVLWGLGMAAQETLLPSIVSGLIPAAQRATALGTFDGIYGIAWFAGSAAMGALYDRSLLAVVIFSVALQIASLPLFIVAARARGQARG